ncbi:MAG: rRNA maturation RNase YbeY [Lachnospiraceae bacterium]
MLTIDFCAEHCKENDLRELFGLIFASAECSLEFMGFIRDCDISVTVTDNIHIHELNREYRGVDRPTDVLSFPMYSFTDDDMPEEGPAPVVLGDIVISVERAKEQAVEYGHSFQREISFLTVHSVLHLLGYDHEVSEKAENEMFSLQDKIMDKLGILR